MQKNCRTFSLILVFILIGCQSPPKRESHSRLFPDGEYTQSVRLEIMAPKKISIPFISLSRIQNTKFKILGLTPFGTKAFEAEGWTQSPESVQVKFHMEVPPELPADFVKKTLSKIQNLHGIQRNQLIERGDHHEYLEKNLRLKIYKFNDEGIPTSFVLSEDNWLAYIQTSQYKAL